jgi:hypothetical protein
LPEVNGLASEALDLGGVEASPAASSKLLGTASFGFNWTHPNSPLAHPWRFHSVEDLGASIHGVESAAVPSFRTFEASGFVAVVLPFLSADYLPEQRGTAAQVTDFRLHAVRRSAASDRIEPRYFCVRLSWNGEHIHQICDPNDPTTGRTTGVVRAAVEDFFNDLKRGHFIDRHTRALTLTLPVFESTAWRGPNAGLWPCSEMTIPLPCPSRLHHSCAPTFWPFARVSRS